MLWAMVLLSLISAPPRLGALVRPLQGLAGEIAVTDPSPELADEMDHVISSTSSGAGSV